MARKGSARGAGAPPEGKAKGKGTGARPKPPRPTLLERLTWLVLVAFVVLLAVGHG